MVPAVIFAESIWNSGDSLLGLINDMLDFSRIGAGKYPTVISRTDLRSSATAAVYGCRVLAEEGEMGALALWGCRLEGGKPFPVLVDPAHDVEDFKVLSGEDTRVLCHTLVEEVVVVSLKGESSEISQRFP